MSETGGALASAPPDCAVKTVRPAPHIHLTTIDETTIVLDLKRDKYLALHAEQFKLAMDGAQDLAAARLRVQLTADGVLIGEAGQTGAANAPRRPVFPLSFAVSMLWAEYRLRRRRLDLAALALSRAQLQPLKPRRAMLDALAEFRQWRPWYPRKTVCLFDSLALARFLILSGHRIELVFGVRVNGFAAHCWVEAGGAIVNDEPHYCAAFQEIARIR